MSSRTLKIEILKLRQEGKSYRDIEKILNCNRSIINYHCKKHNLTDTGKKRYAISNETKIAISKFCKTNNFKDAIKYFKLSKTTIYKFRNFEIKQDEQK